MEQHDAEDRDGPQPGDLRPKLTCHGLRIAIASNGSSRSRIDGLFSNHWTQIIAAKIRRNLVDGDEIPSTKRAQDADQTCVVDVITEIDQIGGAIAAAIEPGSSPSQSSDLAGRVTRFLSEVRAA